MSSSDRGLVIHRLEGANVVGLKADRRLWLNRDRSKVVEDGDVNAAFLLAAPGRIVPQPEVERFGLSADAEGKIQLAPKPKPKPKKKWEQLKSEGE
jgi:hypothetical protein